MAHSTALVAGPSSAVTKSAATNYITGDVVHQVGLIVLFSKHQNTSQHVCRFGKDRAEAILQDASLSHAERTAALQQARQALEAELRAKGMFRLEVSPVVP